MLYKTCQKIVWFNTQPASNTYCIRPEGHEGECSAHKLLGDHTPEEQKEILARTHVSWGTNGETNG